MNSKITSKLFGCMGLVAAILLIVACGSTEPIVQPTSAPPPATSAPSEATAMPQATAMPEATTAPDATAMPEATTATGTTGANLQLLGWSSSDAENELLNTIIADYNSSQQQYVASFEPVPNYDQSLQTALAGGAPPDVFYLDSLRFPDFNKNAALAEPPANGIEDPDDFYPSLKSAFSANGTFYCAPKDFSTLALIYNEQMLTDAGVEVPTTWEELAAAAKTLTSAENGTYGLSLSADAARWLAFLYQAGGQVVGDDGKMNINTPEAKAALDYYTGLLTEGSAVTPDKVDSGWNGEAFGKQKVAMTIEGNWIVPALKNDFPDVEYGIAELPAGPAGKATLAFTVCYAVPKNAKDAEGSWSLANALTSKEGMQKWTDLGSRDADAPELREAWIQKFPDLKVFLDGAEYSHPWQFSPGFTVVTDAINKGIQEIAAGQSTTDAVLETVQQAGEDILGSQ